MIRSMLRRFARRFERTLGVELPYLDEVIESAPGAMGAIAGFLPASAYGRHLPSAVLHMVRIGASHAQDCGECLQIAVNVARGDGVSPQILEAAVWGRLDDLDPELAVALEFGARVGSGLDAPDERASIRARFGGRGVVEAAMAAASAQLFPVLKRGMGFAHSCDLDTLDVGARAPSSDRGRTAA